MAFLIPLISLICSLVVRGSCVVVGVGGITNHEPRTTNHGFKFFLRRGLYLFLLVTLLALGPSHKANADDNLQLAEQKIKAGLLYNFLKYTSWPAAAMGSETVVCVYGDDPFSGSLQPMGGRSVNQHVIAVKYLKNISDAGSCNLLFINAEESSNWAKLRESLAGKSILTVSDFDGFAESGGMIEFKRKDNRVVAVLNLEAVKKANLQVEGRLLKLVTVLGDGK